MTATIQINGQRAKAARLLIPWNGAWSVDLDFDLGDDRIVPTGAAELVVAGVTILGTFTASSGRFAEHAKATIVGGAGGWSATVAAKHFHNDAGVKLSTVLETTAAEVGERIGSGPSTALGADYVRISGYAARVLDGIAWHTDFERGTVVGERPALTLPEGVDVLSWDPEMQRLELAADALILPGMVVFDDRFGSVTIRDVEQTFGDAGAKATAWCGPVANTRAAGALAAFVAARSGAVNSRAYRYRVVLQGPDRRLTLQAVSPSRGTPDLLAISMWPGMSGLSALLLPSSQVLVEFIGGDPASPIVTGFEHGSVPLLLELSALAVNVVAPVMTVSGAVACAAIVAGGMTVPAGGGMGVGALEVSSDPAQGVAVGGLLATPVALQTQIAAIEAWVAALTLVGAARPVPIVIPPLAMPPAAALLRAI